MVGGDQDLRRGNELVPRYRELTKPTPFIRSYMMVITVAQGAAAIHWGVSTLFRDDVDVGEIDHVEVVDAEFVVAGREASKRSADCRSVRPGFGLSVGRALERKASRGRTDGMRLRSAATLMHFDERAVQMVLLAGAPTSDRSAVVRRRLVRPRSAWPSTCRARTQWTRDRSAPAGCSYCAILASTERCVSVADRSGSCSVLTRPQAASTH